MAISYVGAGTFSSGTTGATPGLPSGWQEGDIFLLFMETRNGGASQAPAGWTSVTNSPQFNNDDVTQANDVALDVMWRRATASETDPISIGDTGNHVGAIVHGFRGCLTTGDPWDVTAGTTEATSDTTVSLPSVTTTVANTYVVMACALNDTATFSGQSNSNLTSLTERSDNNYLDGNDGSLAVWTGEKATAGSTGITSVTASSSRTKAMITIALEPAVAGTDHEGNHSDTVTLADVATPVHGIGHSHSASDTLTLDDSASSVSGEGYSEDHSDTVSISDSVSVENSRASFILETTVNVHLGYEI